MVEAELRDGVPHGLPVAPRPGRRAGRGAGAFLRGWRFRDALPEGEARKAWLYRVVVKACLSRIRSERTYTGRDVGEAQLAGDVVAALAGLPEALRVPLVLRCYAGLSEKEIAVAIDRRPGTVRSRLYDARQRLALDPRLAAWVLPQEAAQ